MVVPQWNCGYTCTPTRPPVPVGASIYNGKIVACLQDDTYSYFQTGVQMTGTLRWGDFTEEVVGHVGPYRSAVVPELCRRRRHRRRHSWPGTRMAHHQPRQRRRPERVAAVRPPHRQRTGAVHRDHHHLRRRHTTGVRRGSRSHHHRLCALAQRDSQPDAPAVETSVSARPAHRAGPQSSISS